MALKAFCQISFVTIYVLQNWQITQNVKIGKSKKLDPCKIFQLYLLKSSRTATQVLHAYNSTVWIIALKTDSLLLPSAQRNIYCTSVTAQQVNVLCSESWWGQTFCRGASLWSVTRFWLTRSFFEIMPWRPLLAFCCGRSLSLWCVAVCCRSVKMESLSHSLFVLLTRQGCCIQHLSDELLPANWRATTLKMIWNSCWEHSAWATNKNSLISLQKRSAEVRDSSIFFCFGTREPFVSHWFTT